MAPLPRDLKDSGQPATIMVPATRTLLLLRTSDRSRSEREQSHLLIRNCTVGFSPWRRRAVLIQRHHGGAASRCGYGGRRIVMSDDSDDDEGERQ
jgi:hypothetical protein